MTFTEAVGKSLRKARELKQMTQLALSQKTEYSQFTLSRIEAGKQSINIEHLKVICDALEIQPHRIVMDAQDEIECPF